MRALAAKLKPATGFSPFFHLGLTSLLPVIIYVFARLGSDYLQLAFPLILLSKWRMFAVRPRYWLANLRANAVDIMVGFSLVVFMGNTTAANWQLIWAIAYGLWLIVIKPGSNVFMVTVQALLGQVLALMALFIAWSDAPLAALVVSAWAVCYLSARHFFSSFDEPYSSLFAHTWGYFAGALVWVLGHWLLFYASIAQPTLLLNVIGLGLGTMYYLNETDKLSVLLRRQFIFIMTAVIVIVLVFSDWGDQTI